MVPAALLVVTAACGASGLSEDDKNTIASAAQEGCEDSLGNPDEALERVTSSDQFPSGDEAHDYAQRQVSFRCEDFAEANAESDAIADRIMSSCRSWEEDAFALTELVSPATPIKGAVSYPELESTRGTTPILVIVEIAEADWPALIAYTGDGEPESNSGLWSSVNFVSEEEIGFPANDAIPERLTRAQNTAAALVCIESQP